MNPINRRDFFKLAGVITAAGVFAPATLARAAKHGLSGSARVVVVGGGFGGATCARYLRRLDPGLSVTLVEPNKKYVTCPFSNLVLGGLRTMSSITHGFDGLRKNGVNVVHDTVTSIDAEGKKLKLKNGKTLSYDRLVVSPGIDFRYDAIHGYSEKAAQVMPHAWKAGPQTVLLQQKLKAMKNGGTCIIVAPPNPFRCPPGPYERASMIAHYFKQHKPRSKILILDAKDKFSKQGLFEAAWSELYPGMIEWVSGAKGGAVKSIDTKKMIVDAFAKQKADVVNLIPAQTAAKLALASGLADDKGWCPVDPKTFESKIHPGVHVIGDASIAGALPKSGFAASSEAKMCAAAIVALLRGETPAENSMVNTCYSLIAPEYAISVAGVYRVSEKGIVEIEGAGGVSPKDAPESFRAQEAKYTVGWYQSITADIWG